MRYRNIFMFMAAAFLSAACFPEQDQEEWPGELVTPGQEEAPKEEGPREFRDYLDEYGVNHGVGVEIDGVVWAPVNCGYHETDFVYGKLYQWGRRYGQGYSGDLCDDWNTKIGDVSDALLPAVVEGGVSESAGNSKSNEDVFFKGTQASAGDWIDTRNDKLWNSGSENTPVRTGCDPCPEGWRIPTSDEMYRLLMNTSWSKSNTSQNGCRLISKDSEADDPAEIFLPAAGCRIFSGYTESRGYYGYYWSSKPYYDGYNSASLIYFRCSDSQMVGYCPALTTSMRSNGYSVRCVQE